MAAAYRGSEVRVYTCKLRRFMGSVNCRGLLDIPLVISHSARHLTFGAVRSPACLIIGNVVIDRSTWRVHGPDSVLMPFYLRRNRYLGETDNEFVSSRLTRETSCLPSDVEKLQITRSFNPACRFQDQR